MAVKIEFPYVGKMHSKRSLSETYSFISKVERSIGELFPGLESFDLEEDAKYHWLFQKVSKGGYSVQIELYTKFDLSPPNRINILSIPEKGNALLEGHWLLNENPDGCEVSFQIQLTGELAVPFFLKSALLPVVEAELTKLFNLYLQNVSSALEK